MNPLLVRVRRLLAATSLALALPLSALAAPTSYCVPYQGAGNLSGFDAGAGTGGGVGRIDQVPPPDVPQPLSLVSFVTFTLDPATLALSGHFEFTSTDLTSTLFGDVSGYADNADLLTLGGQLSLDYSILGGSGDYTDATGYGLAFVNYDPAGTFNNYGESGVLVFDAPEPGSLALVGLALLLAAVPRRTLRMSPLRA